MRTRICIIASGVSAFLGCGFLVATPLAWGQGGPDTISDSTTSEPTPAVYSESVAVDPVPAETKQETRSISKASGSRLIEEIIVTAQKREENLQDVPISVSAFSGEKLEALGVTDPRGLELVTPGLAYSSLVGYSIIYLRGVGTDVFIPSGDTSVATYIDGIYLPFAHSLASEFTKLERVEVLKGPQGTLFGRNTTGGAINIITKKPSDDFQGSIDATLSSFDARKVKGFVSGPLISDSLSGSAAFIYSNTDSYYHLTDASVARTIPEDTTKGIHLRLRWQVTDTLSWTLSGLQTRFNGLSSVINTAQNPKPALAALMPAPQGEYEASYNDNTFLKADNDLIYSEMLFHLDALDVKLLASHQKVQTDTLYDFDATEIPLVYFRPANQFSSTTTSELQLSSKPGGWLADEVQWTAGLYYYQSKGGFDPVFFGAGGTQADPVAGLPIPGVTQLLTRLGLPTGVKLQLQGVVETTAYSAYSQATWAPVEWFGLTLGARYQTEDRGTTKASTSLANGDGTSTSLLKFPLESTTTNNFSPKVSLDFHPFGDDTLVYASWQRGYKSGTYNVISIYSPPTYVKPERATAIELGLKGKLFDGTLQYSTAAFENKIKNLQTQFVSLTSGGVVQLLNAAQATIRGAEFDLTWQAFPESLPGFVMTAGGAYMKGEYDDFPNAPGFSDLGVYYGPGELVPTIPVNDAGNTTVRTPEFAGTLGLSQFIDVSGGNLELSVNGTYNSGYFYDTQNTESQPKYVVINARASYLYEPWNLRLTAFGANLNDEVYYYNKFTTDFGTNATYAPPRSYGVTVAWEFH